MPTDPELIITDTSIKHPSFGQIRISRWTGNTKEHLFNTNVETGAGIAIELHEAEILRRDTHEHVFGGKILFKVDLSPAQFAELLTNMNTEGAACTIRYNAAYPGFQVPRPPLLETAMAKVESEFNQAMLDLEVIDEEVGLRLRTALEKLPAKHRATVTEAVNLLTDRVKSQIPYIREKFEEATAKTVTQAKQEIDAYAQTIVQAMGIESLRNGVPSLNFEQKTLGAPSDTIKE
jgi:hypothetical protein